MKKALYILILLLLTVWTAANALAQSRERFVRQKVQPNFFIPGGALAESKPEKVFVPRYRKGQTTAKRISADDTLYAAQPAQRKPQAPKRPDNSVSYADTNDNEPVSKLSEPAPSQTNDGTPEYQKMYQDYLQDLESIAQNGNVKDQAVLDDLNVMNSEKRIELDKKFNKSRDIEKDVQAALKNKF